MKGKDELLEQALGPLAAVLARGYHIDRPVWLGAPSRQDESMESEPIVFRRLLAHLPPLHVTAHSQEGERDVSVFIADTVKAPEMADIAKNAVKRFKTIRHPNVLSVVATHEANGVYYIVTERVTPLQHVLGDQLKEPDEMLYGIKQVGV